MTDVAHRKQYYPALDGLRGAAILLVVFFHNFGFINYSVFGWLGVDLFFVLSGFLITDILLTTVRSKNYLRNFYARRILRVFPLYYLFLIVVLSILPRISDYKDQLEFYVAHQWWLWVYLQNWLYSFYTPANTGMLNHLWSLAVEEQFYLVWPFAVLLVRKPKILLWLLLLFLLGILVIRFLLWVNKVEDLTYSSLYTFTRVDGICIGCIVALLSKIDTYFIKRYTTIIVITFAILNFLFYFLNEQHDFPYFAFIGYTTFAGIFGLVVYETILGSTSIINLLFNQRILKFFGIISYGLYIFHWPIYLITRIWLHDFFRVAAKFPDSLSTYCTSIVATMLAIIVSVISFYFFELKFLRLKRHFV